MNKRNRRRWIGKNSIHMAVKTVTYNFLIAQTALSIFKILRTIITSFPIDNDNFTLYGDLTSVTIHSCRGLFSDKCRNVTNLFKKSKYVCWNTYWYRLNQKVFPFVEDIYTKGYLWRRFFYETWNVLMGFLPFRGLFLWIKHRHFFHKLFPCWHLQYIHIDPRNFRDAHYLSLTKSVIGTETRTRLSLNLRSTGRVDHIVSTFEGEMKSALLSVALVLLFNAGMRFVIACSVSWWSNFLYFVRIWKTFPQSDESSCVSRRILML